MFILSTGYDPNERVRLAVGEDDSGEHPVVRLKSLTRQASGFSVYDGRRGHGG